MAMVVSSKHSMTIEIVIKNEISTKVSALALAPTISTNNNEFNLIENC